MFTHPNNFTNHVFQFISRNNPALPFSAQTAEKAAAKIWAAGLVLRLLCESDDPTRILAIAELDAASGRPRPMNPVAPENVRWGSGRRYAADRGGYYSRCLDGAIEFEFSVLPDWETHDEKRAARMGRILRAAFPQTWQAIVEIAQATDEKVEELEEKIESIVKGREWEITNPVTHKMRTRIREIAADKFAVPYSNEDDFDLVEETIYDDVLYCYVQIAADDLHISDDEFDEFPVLHPVMDAEWHLVDEIHQMGNWSGICFYRSKEVHDEEDD